MTTRPYSGIWPVAPTPFTETGAVDDDGMRRVIDCMIDQGCDGICILANFSEQFLISDAERAHHRQFLRGLGCHFPMPKTDGLCQRYRWLCT